MDNGKNTRTFSPKAHLRDAVRKAYQPPKSLALIRLLDRIHRNETPGSGKDAEITSMENQREILKKKIQRRRAMMKNKLRVAVHSANREQKVEKICYKKYFQTMARRVLLLNRVFARMRECAIENGDHSGICSNAMQLKDSVQEEERDLLFNPNNFKCRQQVSFPIWARKVCKSKPEHRTPEQLHNIVSIMRQLKDFRKYSKKMQLLLAKIARYECFGRRRVVIRKGHFGVCFYFVFSGSVGVVIDTDEDKAFDKDGRSLVNVMRKGDSFGEVALVQKCRRSATAVCMEYTEFLVIDKDQFYELGIDKFAEEEMMFRFNFMKSLDIFSTWKDDDLIELASGGRNMEYLCDKVIEEDSTKSEFIWIITKGHAHVLRLLDLPVLENLQRNEMFKNQKDRKKNREMTSAGTSRSGYYSAKSTDLNSKPTSPGGLLPGYNTPARLTPVSPISETTVNQQRRSIKKRDSNHSLSSGYSSDAGRTSPRQNWQNLRKKAIKKIKTPKFVNQLSEIPSWQRIAGAESCKGNLGLGAYIRIDTLGHGDVFGFKYAAKEENRHVDCLKKFVLLSAGCDVIRISKPNVQKMTDNETISKIEQFEPGYPSDEILFEVYRRYHDWRTFREKLVDDIALYQTNVTKAINNRSLSIPKIPRIENKAYSRIQSPVEHWNMLKEEGHLKQEENSQWKVTPIPSTEKDMDEVIKRLRAAPFLQDQLLKAKGSQRQLILTHGGDRVNRFPKVVTIKQ